jgi:hypothetical protein
MKLYGFRQKGQLRGLSTGLSALAITLTCAASHSATDQVNLILPPMPTSQICTLEAASEWQDSLRELRAAQSYNLNKARETLFEYYIPEIAKLVRSLPDSEKSSLGSNILLWLTPENFEKGLDLKSRASETLSPDEVAQLLSFETCWQSLLSYVLTLNPDYRDVEDINIISRPNFFNEPFREVERVNRNRYLSFLVNGTIKLSEILRSAKVLMSLAERQGSQVCGPFPYNQGFLEQAWRK